jgi:serine/threonine-protein kinase
MGVVFRATQLALQRPVALKAIAPELAEDESYRERFQHESHLAASIDHPNVIPVYEAGERDGKLYLIMRWVEGTDLRTLLSTSGRIPPARAIRLLRPVASALAAAHRRGLVHRDVKPANVLIASSDEEYEDQIYLTDFGIARRTDGESLTRTGMFVGTIDYTAPERIEGGKGDASSDIYSFGCMLFEALTGHVPFDRPSEISKIFAHVNDPIPSARSEVDEVPKKLDVIVAKAMAKDPTARFASAGELSAALGQALNEVEPAQRVEAEPTRPADVTKVGAPTTVAAPREPTVPAAASTEPIVPAAASTEPIPTAAEPRAPSGPPTTPLREPGPPSAPPSARRSPILWLAPIALLVVAGVLIAALASGGGVHGKSGATSTPAARPPATAIKIQGAGLTEGQRIVVAGRPGSISLGRRNLWISLPDRAELVRYDLHTGRRATFPATGRPTAIVAGTRALWVADTASKALDQFNGDSGARVAATTLPGTPASVALDQGDSSAWVADSSGAVSHIALGGGAVGTPAHSDPAPTSIDWGEGWLWATNGSAHGLVRISLSGDGSSTSYDAGTRPLAVALDQGVWTASANGHVTRFDPRPGFLRVNADIAVASSLDAIAAKEQSRFVWTMSTSARKLYRVTNTGTPAVTGTVEFDSPPVALAVNADTVWVATEDGHVTQIRF